MGMESGARFLTLSKYLRIDKNNELLFIFLFIIIIIFLNMLVFFFLLYKIWLQKKTYLLAGPTGVTRMRICKLALYEEIDNLRHLDIEEISSIIFL